MEIKVGNRTNVEEIDVEGEISRWLENGDITDTRYDDYSDEDIKITARHFFELGLKARKDGLK